VQRLKDGALASACSTREFSERVMETFQMAATWVMLDNEDFFEEHGGALWSMDTASIHTSTTLVEDKFGIRLGSNRLPLPPLSGDMHLVIERAHARAGHAFQRKVLELGKVERNIEVYKRLFRDAFYAANTPKQVQADIASLPALYQAIIDAQGGYVPAKRLR
jgi:hypothetical protein